MLPGAVAPAEVLRGLGMLAMAVLFGVRFVPALRGRRRAIELGVLGCYFGVAGVVLVFAYLL